MPTITERGLAGDDRWALVTRLVSSRHFGKAVQLRELLLFLAEKSITSPAEDVSEQEIGSRVLGRRPDYDPQEDNIVRVQIRRLRQKLDEYFLGEGREESMVVAIPKGSHVLRFEPRAEPEAASRPSRARWLWLAGVAAVGVVAFLLGRMSTEAGQAATQQGGTSASRLWSRLFVKDQPTTIVIADSSVVIVQNILGQNLTLNDYIDRSYRNLIEAVEDAPLRDALRWISVRQYTSLADATVSSDLRSLGGRMGAKVSVRYARHMNIRDYHAGNFILVGSRHSVPWVELFEPNLNFVFEPIGKGPGFGIRNRKPAEGEASIYASTAHLSGPQESFATIAMLPNLGRNGTVLTLSGVTMEATEAAGEFSRSGEFAQLLAKNVGTDTAQPLPHFEVLLKTAVMAGAPRKVEVVAWRKLAP